MIKNLSRRPFLQLKVRRTPWSNAQVFSCLSPVVDRTVWPRKFTFFIRINIYENSILDAGRACPENYDSKKKRIVDLQYLPSVEGEISWHADGKVVAGFLVNRRRLFHLRRTIEFPLQVVGALAGSVNRGRWSVVVNPLLFGSMKSRRGMKAVRHFAAVVFEEMNRGHGARGSARSARWWRGIPWSVPLFDVLSSRPMPFPQGHGHIIVEYGGFQARPHL